MSGKFLCVSDHCSNNEANLPRKSEMASPASDPVAKENADAAGAPEGAEQPVAEGLSALTLEDGSASEANETSTISGVSLVKDDKEHTTPTGSDTEVRDSRRVLVTASSQKESQSEELERKTNVKRLYALAQDKEPDEFLFSSEFDDKFEETFNESDLEIDLDQLEGDMNQFIKPTLSTSPKTQMDTSGPPSLEPIEEEADGTVTVDYDEMPPLEPIPEVRGFRPRLAMRELTMSPKPVDIKPLLPLSKEEKPTAPPFTALIESSKEKRARLMTY